LNLSSNLEAPRNIGALRHFIQTNILLYDSNMKRIFLDYAAGHDNPNAIYLEGRTARARLEDARARIAKVLSVASDEIIFTSWGAEASSLITKACLSRKAGFRGQEHIHTITTQIEHKSVLDAFVELEKLGVSVTYLKPDSLGFISVKQVEEALRPNTKLVSIMYANNEIGTIQPIKEIARMLRAFKGQTLKGSQRSNLGAQIFHSDCVQAPGLLPINMQSLGVDMATFSAPKFGGPAGIGFVYIRRGIRINVRDAGAVDLAENMCEKLEQAEKSREKEVSRLTKLRAYFIDNLLSWIPGIQLNGGQENRLSNNVNIVTPIDAELCVLELDRYGIAVSAGAACSSGDCADGSHVILALGKNKKEANSSVRFSLGGETSKSQLDYVMKVLRKVLDKNTNLWQTKKKVK